MLDRLKRFFRRPPTEMFFRCFLIDRRGFTHDLGLGYFRRARDENGMWSRDWWDLQTTDSYVVPHIHTEDLPNVKGNQVISPAIIEEKKDGAHEMRCYVRSL